MIIYDRDFLPMIEDDNGCELVVEGVVVPRVNSKKKYRNKTIVFF